MEGDDLSKLKGDALTWALHRENNSQWREVKSVQRVVLVLLGIMLTAQLTGFHVVPDPTIHLHFP